MSRTQSAAFEPATMRLRSSLAVRTVSGESVAGLTAASDGDGGGESRKGGHAGGSDEDQSFQGVPRFGARWYQGISGPCRRLLLPVS